VFDLFITEYTTGMAHLKNINVHVKLIKFYCYMCVCCQTSIQTGTTWFSIMGTVCMCFFFVQS